MALRLRYGFLVVALSLGVAPLLVAEITGGRAAHGAVSQKTAAPAGSYTVQFPATPVGSSSIEDCYYNCFYTGSGQCNSPGTISLAKAAGAPFKVLNLRKGPAGGSCSQGTTPVTLPVTLQANEWLLQDFVFSPTTSGTFQDSQTYNVTPTGSQPDTSTWVLAGSTPAPAITSFAAAPPTIRAGQQVVLTWSTQNATSVLIDQGIGAVAASGAAGFSPAGTTTYTLTALNAVGSTTAQVTVSVITAPSVAVGSFPAVMVQAQGSGGGAAKYTLTNGGEDRRPSRSRRTPASSRNRRRASRSGRERRRP